MSLNRISRDSIIRLAEMTQSQECDAHATF